MNEEKALILQTLNESLSKTSVREKFTIWNIYFLYNPYIEYMLKVMEFGNLGDLITLLLNKKEAVMFLKTEEK